MSLRLRDLSPRHDFARGVRAMSPAGPAAFPFASLRRAFSSLTWPAGYVRVSLSRDYEIPQPDVDYDIDGSAEAQGLTFDDRGRQVLVTTNSTYVIQSGYEASYEEPGIPPGCDGYFRKVVDGVLYTGRRQLDDSEGSHPHKHLSAPTTYGGFIVLPAEGEMVRFDDSDDTVGGSYQMLWVLDMATHGYVGRIMLDAVSSGLGTSIAWCSIDPESRLIYASSYGDDPEYRAFVSVFRLPAESVWDQFRSAVPSLEMGKSAARSAEYPCVQAEFLGNIPLRHGDGYRFTLRLINGGIVTPSGRLYLSFNKIGPEEVVIGVTVVDLLTGREVQYITLGFADSVFDSLVRQERVVQGLAMMDGGLHCCIWDWDAIANDWQQAVFRTSDGVPL